jgi:hypothetical protein
MGLVLTKKQYIGLTNHGAESGSATGWTTYSGGTLSVNSNVANVYEGAYSFFYASSSLRKQYQRVDLTAWAFTAAEIARGLLKIYVRCKGRNIYSTSQALVGVRTADTAGTAQDANDAAAVTGSTSGTAVWFDLEETLVGRSDTRYVDVILGAYYYGYVDNAELEVQLWEEDGEDISWPMVSVSGTSSAAPVGYGDMAWPAFSVLSAGTAGEAPATNDAQGAVVWPVFETTGQTGGKGAVTWPLWSLDGMAYPQRKGDGAVTWPVLTVDGRTGAQAEVSWPSFVAESTCTPPSTARSELTWPLFELNTSVTQPFIGRAEFSWPLFGVVAEATNPIKASAAITWPAFAPSAVINTGLGATAGLEWPLFAVSGEAHRNIEADAALTWPLFSVAAAGLVPIAADASIVWPAWVMGGSFTPGATAYAVQTDDTILRFVRRA